MIARTVVFDVHANKGVLEETGRCREQKNPCVPTPKKVKLPMHFFSLFA